MASAVARAPNGSGEEIMANTLNWGPGTHAAAVVQGHRMGPSRQPGAGLIAPRGSGIRV
jgi:hypothetical protein